MASKTKDKYRFRNADQVGAAAAEDDSEYLETCFVDSGEVARLLDCKDRASIILGRTGSGKSALILRVAKNPNAVVLSPDDLALSYLANSNILRFVASLGVKIEIFFRLLWRHALIVEVLKKHFQIRDKSNVQKLFDWISQTKERKNAHRKAQRYLETWGESFWETTEVRVKELVKNIETQLTSSIGLDIDVVSMGGEAGQKLSEQVRADVRHRAQEVVNSVQIKELSEILELLNGVLEDDHRPYYVIIDHLDEDWIADELRLHLIRALVETARTFRKVRNAKIIVALRSDLLERVYRATRDSGFQEEKLKSLYLRVSWTKSRLEELLDKRVAQLIRKKYVPTADVRLVDLLPSTIKTGRQKKDRCSGLDFILQRTMMRPRDAIAFLNCLIANSEGRADFSGQQLKLAEGEHSRDRLRALQDEWYGLYPNLIEFCRILQNEPCQFSVEQLEDRVSSFCGGRIERVGEDELAEALDVYMERVEFLDFARIVLSAFYRVGMVGLKLSAMESAHWSSLGNKAVSPSEIQADTRVYVHPCFWRVFGTTGHHTAFKPR